jgi:ABC-type ATPase with predicted acetyltransferase domain
MRSFRHIAYDTVCITCHDRPKFLDAYLVICESSRREFRLQLKVTLPSTNVVIWSFFERHHSYLTFDTADGKPYGPRELEEDLPAIQDAFIQLTKRFAKGHGKVYI